MDRQADRVGTGWKELYCSGYQSGVGADKIVLTVSQWHMGTECRVGVRVLGCEEDNVHPVGEDGRVKEHGLVSTKLILPIQWEGTAIQGARE